MGQTPLTNPSTRGELAKWDVDQRYTRQAITVTNDTGADVDIDDVLGQPLTVDVDAETGVFVKDTEEAATNAIVIDVGSLQVANTATVKLLALVRGPALINEDMLPDSDVNGNVFTTPASIVTGLKDEGIRMYTEPEKQEVQTT